nr:MAG TPA: hypothetical protein [Caudoviricetes sp.]
MSPGWQPSISQTRARLAQDTSSPWRSCWIVLSPSSFSVRRRYEVYPRSFSAARMSVL